MALSTEDVQFLAWLRDEASRPCVPPLTFYEALLYPERIEIPSTPIADVMHAVQQAEVEVFGSREEADRIRRAGQKRLRLAQAMRRQQKISAGLDRGWKW